jgi:hypothetical protein
MTPKEKAKELFNKYLEINYHYYQAKDCALIAVDEIIDELTNRGILSGFWYEVHLEIKKL